MTKTIITIACLLLLYPLQAKQIEYKDYYPNGKLHYQFNKNSNCLHGSYTYWHPNGQKAVEGNFKKGKREGLWKAWYENGNQVYERTFIEGKEQGITTYWYENGIKQASGEYSENMRNGKWQIWNNDGGKRAEGTCKLNSFHGEWKFWDNDTLLTYRFRFGNILLRHHDMDEFLEHEIRSNNISKSLVFIDQKIDKEIRFIFRMNCRKTYFLERDFNKNHEYNGMFNFRSMVYLDRCEIDGDRMSGTAFYIVSQTSEFNQGNKDGKFNTKYKYIVAQESYDKMWDTIIISEKTQDVNYSNDLIIGKYVKSNGSIRIGGKKPYKFIKSYSVRKPKTYDRNRISKPYSTLNNSPKFDSILIYKYGLTRPLFETFKAPDSILQSSILLNDTIHLSFDMDIVNRLKIPYSINKFRINNFFDDFPEDKNFISFLTSANSFKISSAITYNKATELHFIKDPFFLDFGFITENYWLQPYWYFDFYYADNPDIHLPFNHLLHGDVVFYEQGEPIEYYLFDYGFLKEYKKY